jgi:cell division septation protein DedD
MKSALRFDHREIAVIFSLFVFVSLLMFTVGILVGKGLTQAKYEGQTPLGAKPAESLARGDSSHAGASVSMGSHSEEAPHGHSGQADAGHAAPATAPRVQAETHGETHPAPAAAADNHSSEPPTVDSHEAKTPAVEAHHSDESHTPAPVAASAPLKLVPLRPSVAQNTGTNLAASNAETDALLKNPRIASLVDATDEKRPPAVAAAKPKKISPGDAAKTERLPASTGESYTVQVGSYPSETAAQERVEALKKMGFPQASFSANNLGAANGTWYRVWLGQYPDYSTAKKTGDQLQARGEVKNYIVRKN